MNAKKCKALRKQARAMTEGWPEVAYKFPLSYDSEPQRLVMCTRLTYKQLKKAS